jgi:hypothetical protein
MGLFALSGCVGPEVQSYDPKNVTIRSIALIAVPDHEEYRLTNNSATMIGLVAGKANQPGLNRILRSGGFNFGKEMTRALKEELERSGYRVTLVEAQRPNSYRLVGDYGSVNTKSVDAILDVVAGPFIGYETGTPGDAAYRPAFNRLAVQLVDVRNKTVLYGELIKYGSPNVFSGGTEIPAPKQYFYADYETLSSGSAAKDGLLAAIKDAAAYIVRRIRTGGGA